MDQYLFNTPSKRKRNRDTATADLFAPAQPPREKQRRAPHQLSSSTSQQAAEKIEPRIGGDERIILNELAKADPRYGFTRVELERRTGIKTQTITARLNGLWERQEIRKLTEEVDGKVHLVKREGCAAYVLNRKGDGE